MAGSHSTEPLTLKCSKCGQEKPLDGFRPRPGRKDPGYGRRGRCSRCRVCEVEDAKTPHRRAVANRATRKFLSKLRETDREEYDRRVREGNLYRMYRMRIEDYEAMLAAQGGRCAICGTASANGRGRKFHVDHDHATGAVRGLLCHGCNVGIGSFREDPAVLQKAIEYLKCHNV